jgi:hypothetical protein
MAVFDCSQEGKPAQKKTMRIPNAEIKYRNGCNNTSDPDVSV